MQNSFLSVLILKQIKQMNLETHENELTHFYRVNSDTEFVNINGDRNKNFINDVPCV